jgi:nucleoside phosphorylase
MSREGIDRGPPELNLKQVSAGERVAWESKEIQSRLPTDILLLTVNDNEFNACLRYLGQDGPLIRSTKSKNGSEFWFGQFGVEKRDNVKVVLIKTAMGPLEAQSAVDSVAKMLNPKLVLYVGICATMKPNKADLGDVLIATKLICHDLRKIDENNETEYRGPKPEVSPRMAKFIPTAAHGWKAPLKDPESKEVKIHQAVILTGSLLLNSKDEKEKLMHEFRDALGLEMEGEGR